MVIQQHVLTAVAIAAGTVTHVSNRLILRRFLCMATV
jgi:hypothetical protein